MKQNICYPFAIVKEPANSRTQEAPTALVKWQRAEDYKFKGSLLSWIKATDGKAKNFQWDRSKCLKASG